MRKRFALDQPVGVPGNTQVRRHDVPPFSILIMPERPTWVVLTKEEEEAFNLLQHGATVRHAIACSGKNTIEHLLAKLEHAKFWRDDSSKTRSLPVNLTLSLTNDCNLRCRHCYANAGDALAKELVLQNWMGIIEQFHELSAHGEVTLTGGEPTKSPWFWEVAAAVKAKAHRLVVFTNGTYLQPDQLDRLATLADVIQLSLDGLDRQTNDQIRGKGVWDRVHRTFQALYASKVQLRLSICITRDNSAGIATKMVEFMQKMDPERKVGVIFSPTLAAGRNSDGAFTVDYPTVQEVIGNQLIELWKAGWRRPNTFQRNERLSRCGIGGTVVVGPDGSLHACTFAPTTGNVLTEPLAAWRRRELGRIEAFRVESHPKCAACDLRYICRGGCWISSSMHPCGASAALCDDRNRAFYWSKIAIESHAVFPADEQKGGDVSERRVSRN